MQEWPEPIVRVQSLSESGTGNIPERFIKPPSEREAAQLVPEMTKSIPVIDVGGLANEKYTYSEETMRAISNACEEWGFFQLVNHGVSKDVMEKAREVWREFFHLPMEEKEVYSNSPTNYEGYGSRVGVEKDATLDWSDYFFLHLLPENQRNYNEWPNLPTSLRKMTEKYGNEVVKLCMFLMEMLSMSLGLDKGYIREAFGGDDNGACLRVCFYPKCPQPDLTLGLSAHSDPGGFTVLLADENVPGLEVRKGDSWVTVQPLPGAFIVNIADQIQVLSNGTFKSVEHRVQVNSRKERLSMALFFNPKGDVPIGPAEQLLSPEKPALYPHNITFNQYRQFIRQKGLHGKYQVESLKAIVTDMEDDDAVMGGGSGKKRMRWTPELRECFERAVDQLGGPDRATPKGILKTMSVPGLTIAHVKSYLQKYRMSKFIPESSDGGKLEGRKFSEILPNFSSTSRVQITEALQSHMEGQLGLEDQLEASFLDI
ncbi:hypothetical protein J5N97_006027 [Dioscorea zingiberensis]|uniref:Fe2OG dioxygenase domain-containing protein n=1 Tax=Dioscorea zingiberensis TaxID=325984 RepID=A0A9D5D9K4_9LILI|nr:hypothetical protein J5N97_006027 [Dioscorea zingiberensis]